jgi:hypothetical protein
LVPIKLSPNGVLLWWPHYPTLIAGPTEHKQFPPRSLIRPSDRQTVRSSDSQTDRQTDFLSFLLCQLIFHLFFFFCYCYCFYTHADSLIERNGARFYPLRDATAPCRVSAAHPCLLLHLSNPTRLTESPRHSQEPDPTTNARAVPIYATTVRP